MNIHGLGVGIYSAADAARLTHIPRASIDRWLWGAKYRRSGEVYTSPPLWEPQHPTLDGIKALGFRDLIELRFVHAFREKGISLGQIRMVLEKADQLWGKGFPFSSLEFKTDGRKIFANVIESDHRLLVALPTGQLLFQFALDHLYSALDYEDGSPVLWRPFGRNKKVIVDPSMNFGRPVVEQGVPTDTIFAAYSAERSVEKVAEWYQLSPEAVKDAIEFEASLAA